MSGHSPVTKSGHSPVAKTGLPVIKSGHPPDENCRNSRGRGRVQKIDCFQ